MKPPSKALVCGAIGLLVIGLVAVRCGQDRQIDEYIKKPILQANETAKVIVDPLKGTVTTITKTETKVTRVNDRPFAVVTDNAGKLHVVVRKWGTTFRPFAGLSYGDQVRPHIGASLFFIRRIDFNVSLAPTMRGKDLRLVGSGSTRIYSNSAIFLGLDHKKTVHGGIAVRF